MKRKEIIELDKGEHTTKLAELRKELIKLNAQAAIGTAMKNPGLLKQTKKNIARLHTLMYEKKARVTENK